MTEVDIEPAELLRRIDPLFKAGSCALDTLDLPVELVLELGLALEDGVVSIPSSIETLDATRMAGMLSSRARIWLKTLNVSHAVESTNTLLTAAGQQASVDGQIEIAELQVGGRGRRGRRWLSPYARNLAMSVGIGVSRPTEELGGASLCVGLAAVDRLSSMGVKGLELKWPNDILVEGRKLAGILIELVVRETSSELIVGLGMNFSLDETARQQIGQPVVDINELGLQLSRNEVAAGLISSLVDYMEGFSEHGFEPMREMFNAHHRFHGASCQLLQGERVTTGVVEGVSARGELLLKTSSGIETFNSGEVSLRAL